MSYALGAAKGTAATTGIARGAGPASPSAIAQANNLAETAGRIMEDPFLDDVVYNHAQYISAFQRTQSTLQRIAQATGLVELPEEQAKQLLMGSVQQAKRGIAHIRVMAQSYSPRARQLEQQAIAAVGNLLQHASQLLREAKATRQQRTGASGLGFIVFIGVLVGYLVLRELLSSTSDVDDLARAMNDCETQECRDAVTAAFHGAAEEAGLVDNFVGKLTKGVFDIFTPIIWVVAAGVGVYALWVFSPVIIGGGKKVRGALKRRVTKNPRRRRRTSRRRRA